MSQGWEEWGAVATAGGTIVAAIALGLLAYQLYLQRQEHKLQAITLLYSELNTTDFRKALRFVYARDPAKLTLEHLSVTELEQVEMVIAHLDRLGFRVRTGQIPENECYHLFWDILLRTAQQLQLHLQDQREKRGNISYKDDYDWLTRKFKLRHLGKKARRLSKERKTLSELLEIEALPVFRFPATEVPDRGTSHNTF